MSTQILEFLNAQIEERKELIMSHMAGGSCADFPTYKELCGRVAGLAEAQREINDLLQRVKDHDDE